MVFFFLAIAHARLVAPGEKFADGESGDGAPGGRKAIKPEIVRLSFQGVGKVSPTIVSLNDHNASARSGSTA